MVQNQQGPDGSDAEVAEPQERGGERCVRCDEVGEDRRTIRADCFYELDELKIPWQKEILLDAKVEDLEPAQAPYVHATPEGAINLDAGTVRCKGELTPERFYTLRVCKRCRADFMKMLRAWFFAAPTPKRTCGSGIFIREHGTIVEITEEEWYRRKEQKDKDA